MRFQSECVRFVGIGIFSLLILSPSLTYADDIQPPLPPLLQNVTAVSRSGDICNPAKDARLDGAPELNQRLLQIAPVGSSESHLVDVLVKQGFDIGSPCKNDPLIHSANFA